LIFEYLFIDLQFAYSFIGLFDYSCATHKVSRINSGLVAPFGDRRIIGCWHLPGEFRRLLRPSSASAAKASTICLNSKPLSRLTT
jgi:hypothetical protein